MWDEEPKYDWKLARIHELETENERLRSENMDLTLKWVAAADRSYNATVMLALAASQSSGQ